MKHRIILLLGVLLIAGGLLGASLTWAAGGGVSAQDNPGNLVHGQVQDIMGQVMGEDFTDHMHAAMPNSATMMSACASGMEGMMSGGGMHKGGMMDHTD